MLEEKLNESELEWMELFYDSQCVAECLFSNPDNLALFTEEDFIHMRLAQIPMLSWEYGIFSDIPGLSEKEKMAFKENCGNIFQFGGRGYGKTWTVEKIDTCEYVMFGENEEAGFSSFDMMHIRGVLETIIKALEYHPILKIFKKSINRGLNYRITTRNGVTIESVNMNIADGKRAGDQFFQKHFKRLYIVEASKENKIVYEKRADSRHEMGCVAKGSKILLSDLKTKNIEDCKIGDEILAYDEEKNQTCKAKILNVIYQGNKNVINILQENGHNLWLTPDHKIRVLSKGHRIYRWNEAIKCSLTTYKTQTINYIDIAKDNYKGILWGDSLEIKLNGFEKNIDCYDLTTSTGNFIANGFIVHNCVERIAGMTNFTKNSPAGKMFFENEHPEQVLNLPQYCNPNYDEKEEKKAIKKYGGKQSIGFRVFVDGDVIQEGVSALDMQRISELCYPRKKDGTLDENVTIKNIEIDKKNFGMYRALCVVDKPQHIDRLVIASDVGEIGGTTEIIVMAEINNKWRYLYNITVRNLPEKDSYLIFKYLYQRLDPNYLALDCTGGSPGRGVYGYLESDPEIDKSRLIWVDFGEKIEVGIEKDVKGNPIRDNGKLIQKFENTTIWSVERLCHLLYEALLFLPLDYKLDEQLNAVVAIIRGNTISYECATEEDHLWQAFQVFAICEWKIAYEGFSKTISTLKQRHGKCGA